MPDRERAVVFDMDDTLVRTTDSKYPALQSLAQSYGMELLPETISGAWGLSAHDFIRKLYGEYDSVENVMGKFATLREQYPSIEEEGAVETMNYLLKFVHVGIVSSASKHWVMDDLQRINFPVEDLLSIQGAEDTPVHKPDPRVFTPIFDRLDAYRIPRVGMVYVGDSLRDFYAAKRAGIDFYGLAEKTTKLEEFHQAGAKTIHRLSELRVLLTAKSGTPVSWVKKVLPAARVSFDMAG